MQQTGFQAGATGKSVFVQVFTASTGLPDSMLLYNSAGMSGGYKRAGAGTNVGFTPATLASGTAPWASGGFVQVLGNVYRLDVPDAALAAGADHVVVVLAATDKVITPACIDITADNYRAAGFTLAQIGGAPWDALQADHMGAGSFGVGFPTVNAIRLGVWNNLIDVQNGLSANKVMQALFAYHFGNRTTAPDLTSESYVMPGSYLGVGASFTSAPSTVDPTIIIRNRLVAGFAQLTDAV